MPVPAAFMKKGRKAAEGSAAEEKSESPMMEKGEGPEYGDAPHGKMGKKPCAACAKKGKKKGSCGCDKGGKMDAALTPMEYLDACDLGIQNRSRAYIRGVLSVREDKKCGGSGIAEGKKCNKGMTGGGMSRQEKVGNVMRVAGTIGGVAGISGAVRSISKGNFEQAHKRLAAANGSTAIAATGTAMVGKATGNKLQENVGKTMVGVSGAMAAGNLAAARRNKITNIKEGMSKVKSLRDRLSMEKTDPTVKSMFPDEMGMIKKERQGLRANIQELKKGAPMSAARRRRANNGGK
jgi:hypothetical protein